MTKDQLWQIYVDKNPNFEIGSVTFTAKGLKKFFDQTFETGAKSVTKKDVPKYDTNNVINDLFGGIFK